MSIIVHENEPIESALKRLHREVMREKILETYRERFYHVSKGDKARAIRREYRKRKRKHGRAVRRMRNK